MTDQTPPVVWIDGDPLMEKIAAAVWEQCPHQGSIVVDGPRNIAAVVAAVLPPLVDRAAVLQEAEDDAETPLEKRLRFSERRNDELRAAADKLRKLIQNTAPAPWWGDDLDEVQSPLGQIARTLGSGDGKAPYPNSRYIAAMHPGVGLALADWLDFEVHRLATTIHPGWQDVAGRHALAVARAINGAEQ